jgi:hypothetical protein
MIREKYNLNVFVMEDLIHEAISYSKINIAPIERSPAQMHKI